MKKLKNFVRVLFAVILALTLSNTQTVEAASDTVVIYEVYGGGDSNGAVYKYDYVVLKNVSKTSQSLDGLYLHKGTTKGAWFDREKVALKGEIAPGAYFVFRGEQPSYKTNGKELPRFDQSAKMQIASSKFAIALTKGSQAPSQTIGGNVIDLVGTNSLNETKPASGANATTSIVRKSDKDTDDNSVDFTTKTHNDGSEPLDYVNETDDSQPEDEKINIYFNPNGGKLPAAYDQYTADEYGDIAVPFERDAYHTIPLPTREGFVFAGYDVDEGTIVDEDGNEQEVRNFLPETDKKYKFSNDEIILTAQWDEIKNSTVTIDPNGGDIKEFYAEKIVPVGQTYKVQPRNVVDLKRDGYKFNGYDVIGTLLDKDGKEVKSIDYLYNQEFTPVGDVTLKARWIEFEGGKVSFEFKFDDGSQFDSTKYQVLLVNLDDQSDIKILQSKNRTKTATGVKAGRYSVKVAGLANDESVKEFKKGSAYGNSGSTSSVNYIDGKTGELTIEFDEEELDPKAYYYINLEKINLSQTYKLTFDYQNENQENISYEVESNLPVAINKPEAREGYKFLGYDVEGKLLDSNKNEVTGRFIPEAEEYYLGSNVKLRAVWKEEQYKFTLTGEGINEITVPGFTRKTEIKLKDVTREGYKFIGWKVVGTLFNSEGKPVTGLITNFDQSYYPGSDVVFTAVWEEVIPEAEKASLIIYEVFGGGGKTGSLYANDYVVIKNTGEQPVNLDGIVLRKGLSNRWTDQSVVLSGELAPGAFYVVSGGNDNEADGGERPVPAVDLADENFNFANRTFALALTTDNKLPSEDNTIDLVGTGKATNFEGKQAATGRNNVSLRRINDGQDTDNNREDFARIEHLRDTDTYPLAYLGDKDLRATVTFAFNKAIDGVNIPEAQKVEVGTEITLPEVSPEVKDGYSFLGWVIGDNKNATANLKPGGKITVEEDTNVMGIWEGAYGKVSLTFHTGEFIDNSHENRDKITKLEDEQLVGGGFNVENQQSGQVTEGKKSSSKGKISINNGLVKGTYTLNVTAPEGYEIVRIARDTGSNGVIEIENNSTISLPRPEAPFNLTMVDSIYVEVKEKEEEKATVTFEFDQNIDGAKLPDPITVPVGTEIELPKLDEEVLGDYSFMGWELDKSYPNKADANPGDTIKVTEDMTVKGYWEGRYGRFAVYFHEGDYFENKDNLKTLTEGFGFATINPRDKTRLEGVLAGENSKNPYFITPNKAQGGGLTKDAYDLEFTIPEGYKIVSIDKKLADGGLEQVNTGERISPYWYPFNLTMVRGVYVQVEKEEPKIELPQGLYIYEIYGGGGLQQSYYANDYVVLQNTSDTNINLAGINLHVSNQWRPEYAYNIPLSGTIKANGYFVIKAGAGFKKGAQKELPRVDLDISGGKLYKNDFDYQGIGLALTMGPEDPNEKNTIDKVGTYYNNQYLVKPATSPHVDSSIRRVAYEDINKTDFEKVSHRPYVEGTADHREPLWYLRDSQEEKVTVTFKHNVSLENNEVPAEQNVWSGTKITLPQVKEEEKFEFKGWDIDGDGQADKAAGEEFEVKENVTITGIWEEEKPEVKTINFVVDPEKGSATGALFAEVIEGEDPLEKAPKVEAKEGYNFVRWEASEDGLTYIAIFEEAQKPVELIRDRSIRFEVQETIAGRSQLSVKTSKAGDVVVIEINGQEVLRKASNEADVFETYELNRTVKLNDKISVYIIRDKQYRSSKINNIINN